MGSIQHDRTIPDPGLETLGSRQQPAMEVPDEDESVRHRCEAAGDPLRGLGQPLEVPQVLDLLRVQPRLDVGEEATIHLHARLKRPHESQNTLAVPLPILWSRVIPAEPEIVIAPDADCTGIGEEINGLFQAVPQLEHVAEDHEAVGTLLMEDIDRPPEVRQALMDVRQDSDPHKQATLTFGGMPPDSHEDIAVPGDFNDRLDVHWESCNLAAASAS